MKTVISILTATFIAALTICCEAGEVKLTTYYPAPYGEYDTIKTTKDTYLATDENANVGIGTTTPFAKLNISLSDYNQGVAISNGSVASMSFVSKLGTGSFNPISRDGDRGIVYGGVLNNPGGGFVIAPWRSNASGIRLSEKGFVGIGTATPIYNLHIVHPGPEDAVVTTGSGANNNEIASFAWSGSGFGYIQAGAPIQKNLVLQGGGGNIGIGLGSVNPTHLIHLSGGAFSDGAVWSDISDKAYKKDIDYGFKYGLKEVGQLKPVYYIHKKDKNNKKQIGFIAQDVMKVIPEVVSGDEGAYGLSYGQLTAVLVKAIQEQQKEIEELRDEVAALRVAK